jgi:SanA protein
MKIGSSRSTPQRLSAFIDAGTSCLPNSESRLTQFNPHLDLCFAGSVVGHRVGSRPNFFYVERIRSTTQLWQLGKVRGVLISGDNSTPHYNEPDQMNKALIAAGVPAEFIACDYAGLRTLDSVFRASIVFGLHSVVIVSQEEHLERALYLASGLDLGAVGLTAADAPKWWQVRQRVREALSRVKAVVDLAIGRQPKHLDEPGNVRLAPRLAEPSDI